MAERPTGLVYLHGVSRIHPGPPPVTALRPCDLEIRAGDYAAITGPSGSGKTTLLNLLGLLDSPTTGEYRLDGLDTGKLPERLRTGLRGQAIGFVFQSFHLQLLRPAIENVMLAMLYRDTPRRERLERSELALRRVGLERHLHRLPGTMSGGEQQRVAIARAIVNRPRLLLCDEPTGNLDSGNSDSILDLLDQLHGEGHTIIVITHNPYVAERAGRRLEMRDGLVSEQ